MICLNHMTKGTVDDVKREELLEKARICVCGEREQDYGTPENNFGVIADFWSDYLQTQIDGRDVAAMMILLKVARVATSPCGGTDDTWVDIAGYAACGAEIGGECE